MSSTHSSWIHLPHAHSSHSTSSNVFYVQSKAGTALFCIDAVFIQSRCLRFWLTLGCWWHTSVRTCCRTCMCRCTCVVCCSRPLSPCENCFILYVGCSFLSCFLCSLEGPSAFFAFSCSLFAFSSAFLALSSAFSFPAHVPACSSLKLSFFLFFLFLLLLSPPNAQDILYW